MIESDVLVEENANENADFKRHCLFLLGGKFPSSLVGSSDEQICPLPFLRKHRKLWVSCFASRPL